MSMGMSHHACMQQYIQPYSSTHAPRAAPARMRARVAAEPRSVEPGGDHSKTTAREFHQISKFQGNFIKYIVIVSVIFLVIYGVLRVVRPVQ